MPKIISITNQRGEISKSTITTLLATTLAKSQENSFQNILILDTDSQGSITKIIELSASKKEKNYLKYIS